MKTRLGICTEDEANDILSNQQLEADNNWFLLQLISDTPLKLKLITISTNAKGEKTASEESILACFHSSDGNYAWGDPKEMEGEMTTSLNKLDKLSDEDAQQVENALKSHLRNRIMNFEKYLPLGKKINPFKQTSRQRGKTVVSSSSLDSESTFSKTKATFFSESGDTISQFQPISLQEILQPIETDLEAIIMEELPNWNRKIDLKDLHPNGKLLSEKEIEKLKNDERVKTALEKKEQLRLPNSVITINGQLYKIYKGESKRLGKGAYGTVKLAQNVDTNEWVAVKVAEVNPHTNKHIHQEFEALQITGNVSNPPQKNVIQHKSKKKGERYTILMKLGPGKPVNKITNLNPAQLIDISVKILEEFINLHNQGVLHRDIKGANMLWDPATGRVSIVDFGAAVLLENISDPTKENYKSYTGGWFGSKQYMAHEILYNSDNPCTYNEATEVYGLGRTLAKLLFDYPLGVWDEIYSYDQHEGMREAGVNVKIPEIPDDKIPRAIWNIVASMADPDPHKRLSLQSALNQLKEQQKEYQQKVLIVSKKATYTVGLLDIDEYNQSSNKEKEALQKALACFDKIWFVQKGDRLSDKEYMALIIELESKGVNVENRLFRGGENSLRTIANIPININDNKNNYFYVTHKSLAKKDFEILDRNNISHIVCDEKTSQTKYKRMITEELISSTVLDSYYNKTIGRLKEALVNLHLSKDQDINKSSQKINDAIQFLEEKKAEGKLTDTLLKKTLNDLCKEITPPTPRNFTSKVSGVFFKPKDYKATKKELGRIKSHLKHVRKREGAAVKKFHPRVK